MRMAMTKSVGRIVAALATLSLGLYGCETSSRKTVNTFEYDGAPQSTREERSSARLQRDEPPPEVEREIEADEDDGEWHMVSPGEMAAPGKPVVDPSRRNP